MPARLAESSRLSHWGPPMLCQCQAETRAQCRAAVPVDGGAPGCHGAGSSDYGGRRLSAWQYSTVTTLTLTGKWATRSHWQDSH